MWLRVARDETGEEGWGQTTWSFVDLLPREFCLYPESHMKFLQGFKYRICIWTIFSLPSFLIALSWVAWSLGPLTIVSTEAFPLLPAFTDTWLCLRDSAYLPALFFTIPALLLFPLHQLETVSAFLPFVRSCINLGDFITHLCLLVLDGLSGAILHVTSVIHFPAMLWIWPSARIIPLSLDGII